MKVAVTSQGPDVASQVDPRLGEAGFLIVVDTSTGRFTTRDNTQKLNAVDNAGGEAAQKVMDLGVDAVITGNVSDKALATLEAGNVKVCAGGLGGSVMDAVERFKAEQLENASKLHGEKYYWT